MRAPVVAMLAVALSTLLITGCATVLLPSNCTQMGAETASQSRYQPSRGTTEAETAHKPLPRGSLAVARVYRLSVNPDKVSPCRYLSIEKELYLQRASGNGFTIEEVRDIYSASGVLIATKSENLTAQLRESGFYSASASLPIPEQTPTGSYRIASRIVLRAKGGEPIVLARADTRFTVLPKR
jgi:hypothetical protein